MKMICRDCTAEFEMTFNKPGFINQCVDCADDVELLGGNMVWHHKTAPELEIKSFAEAKRFASKTKRFGFGVTSCIVASKLTPESRESSKSKSGTEDRAQYNSRLGEKRTIKQ